MKVDLSMDLADLEISEIGSWPAAVKALCFGILATAVLALGYFVVIADKRAGLAGAEQHELDLRHEFAALATTASGLAARRAGLAEATDALGKMLARLPIDAEVPGLVEDITRAALDHDLIIDRIELGAERQAGLYRELPIAIGVAGDYHDIGGFAGDIAGLSRLVTLHDFDLTPRSGSRDLDLAIEARTYRYAEDVPAPPLPGTAPRRTPPRT